MRTKDPETGYIGQLWVGHNYGPDVRCRRCGGRGMWCRGAGVATLDLETILCLRCADEWHKKAGDLFDKHGWKDMRSSPKKRMAAFNDFCQTKPVEVDIAVHNRRIESDDNLFFGAFPHLKKLVEESKTKQRCET
jgi:hypothetical protein